jgi:hypothetical protein
MVGALAAVELAPAPVPQRVADRRVERGCGTTVLATYGEQGPPQLRVSGPNQGMVKARSKHGQAMEKPTELFSPASKEDMELQVCNLS